MNSKTEKKRKIGAAEVRVFCVQHIVTELSIGSLLTVVAVATTGTTRTTTRTTTTTTTTTTTNGRSAVRGRK
jgi:hypothetical protein